MVTVDVSDFLGKLKELIIIRMGVRLNKKRSQIIEDTISLQKTVSP